MTHRSAQGSGDLPQEIRVAHISAYGLRQLSGINRVVLSLASALLPLGVRVSLWCPEDGVGETVLNVVSVPVKVEAARNVALATRTFAGLVRNRSRFQLIHAHQPHIQSLAALLAARILGIPSILTLHVRVPRAGFLRFVDRAVATLGANLAVEVVAVADRVRRDFGLESCTIIPNGVSTSKTDGEPGAGQGPDFRGGDTLHIVFAGRVTETKGVYVLLDALARAASRVERVRLTTYGHVEAPERYEEAKRSLGIQHIVEDRGFDERWRDHLRPGQVFVLPSFYEGLPVAMLEAMAAGLPVVATPVGGIPDLVQPNRTGFLVPVGDPAKLSDALVWLAKRPEEARTMGREAKRLVEAQYSDQTMSAAYRRLYTTLIGRRRSSQTPRG